MALMFAGVIPFASAAGAMLVWREDLALLNTAALSSGDGVRDTSDDNAFESMREFWNEIRVSAQNTTTTEPVTTDVTLTGTSSTGVTSPGDMPTNASTTSVPPPGQPAKSQDGKYTFRQ